jgi:hypothetical protein
MFTPKAHGTWQKPKAHQINRPGGAVGFNQFLRSAFLADEPRHAPKVGGR